MKHITYLFLGENIEECATLITQNILRDGSDEQWQHFNALLWNYEGNDIAVRELIHSPIDETQFYPDDSYLYLIGANPLDTINVSEANRQIKSFFDTNFQTRND
jgi:hypothetical protein